MIGVELTIDDQLVNIINIYAPNSEKEQIKFIDELYKKKLKIFTLR
jgi:hypothetical protein